MDETARYFELLASAQGTDDESGFVVSGQHDHRRLERGELSLDEYLELAVDRALSHVQDSLEAEQLEMMRTILRHDLLSDPTLVRYVATLRDAAGSASSDGDAAGS